MLSVKLWVRSLKRLTRLLNIAPTASHALENWIRYALRPATSVSKPKSFSSHPAQAKQHLAKLQLMLPKPLLKPRMPKPNEQL